MQANEGLIGPRQYVLPHALWRYMNDKAGESAEAMRSVSEKQRAKIDEGFRKNIDSFAGSDAFRAMRADIDTFGHAAFTQSLGQNDQ